jgi:uncharacterized protein (DUF2267 family)
MPEIKEFSTAVKAAEDWIDDLQRRLGWHDRERTYHALLATLHPLRDSLTRDEAIYVERNCRRCCWHPGARGAACSRAAFLERIRDGVHRDPGIDAEEVACAVLPCSRHVCRRRRSRMPRPQRQSRCTMAKLRQRLAHEYFCTIEHDLLLIAVVARGC